MAYWTLLVPFVALFVINLIPKRIRAKTAFALCLVLFLAQASAAVVDYFVKLSDPVSMQLETILGFKLSLDTLGLLLLLSVGIVGATALAVGWSTIHAESKRFGFVNLLLINLIGLNGIALVSDLFSLYIFIEGVAISSYVLIALMRDERSIEGGFKYLVLSGVASALILTSIALLILTGRELTFAALREAVDEGSPLAHLAAALLFCGLFIKGGFVPFHWWLPDAYTSAPTAVSALLAGVGTKASGTFGILRIVGSAFGLPLPYREMLLAVGLLSILVGAFASLGQRDMKRMLSFSSVSQVGYILAGIASGVPLGYFAAAFHFFNHAIATSQLFSNVASVEEETGSVEMNDAGGVGKGMPVTTVTSAIASLSIAGMPPLSGFWSKILIIIAVWQGGHAGYAIVAILASVLTLAYFLGWQRSLFFGKPAATLLPPREHGAGLLVPVLALSALTVGIGLAFPFILRQL